MALPYYGLSTYAVFKTRKDNNDSNRIQCLPEYEAIIPARNEEKHIQKAIFSLINQTHPPRRIHIIDDASNDETLNIILSTLKNLRGTTCSDLKEEKLRNQKFVIHKCYNHNLGIEFHIWVNKGDPLGKGASINELVLRYISSDYFLSLDADTVVEPDFSLKILRHMSENDKIAVGYGYIFTKRENSTIIGKLFEWGRDIANRLGYVIFRLPSNIIGFHYGISGPRVIFKTEVYRKIPRPLDTEAGDTAHAWELQAEGYEIYCDLKTFGVTWEPSTIKGFWKQRLKWHSGPFQNLFIRGKTVLKKIRQQSRKRSLAALYTILYYTIFSPLYYIGWGILLPLLGLAGLIPLNFLIKYYITDFLVFYITTIYATHVLKSYGYYNNENFIGLNKKFIIFYFWFRPNVALIIFTAFMKFIRDVIWFKIKGKKISWTHYT